MGVIKNINYAAFQDCIIDEIEIKKGVTNKRILFIEDDFNTGVLSGLFFDLGTQSKMSDYTFGTLSSYTFTQLDTKTFD